VTDGAGWVASTGTLERIDPQQNAVIATEDLQGPPLPRQPSSNTGLYRIRRKGLRIRFSQAGGD
jgi:hypothetical protein